MQLKKERGPSSVCSIGRAHNLLARKFIEKNDSNALKTLSFIWTPRVTNFVPLEHQWYIFGVSLTNNQLVDVLYMKEMVKSFYKSELANPCDNQNLKEPSGGDIG